VLERKSSDARRKSALTLRAISLETERAILMDIAQTYLQLAEEQDAQDEIIQPPVTEQPQAVAQQQQQTQPKDKDKKK